MGSPLTAVSTAPEQAFAPDVVTLLPDEREQITALAADVTVSPSQSPELFCRQAARAARRLPDRLTELLADFASMGTESGTMLFDSLPVDDPIPDTPPDNRRHVGERTLLARAQAVVNHACGEMVAYEAEGYGRLYQDMVPNREMAQTQTSLGSRVELELHTEQAFSMLRPDIVSLGCVRGHPDAKTYSLPAHLLLEQLDAAERRLLRQRLWMTGVDQSFRMDGHEFMYGDVRGPLPVVSGADEDPAIIFDQDLMKGTDEQSHAMVERITEIYHAHRHGHVLEPGQILLVDNVRTVHGRSSFTPSFGPTDRFLIRSFVVRDLLRTRYARPGNGRMIAARFS